MKLSFLAVGMIFALTGLVGQVMASPQSNATLEKRVKDLEKSVAALNARKPKLDCKTDILHEPASNNHTPGAAPPEGYNLVGGSCAFDSYDPAGDLQLIQVGGTNSTKWSCYAKSRHNLAFTLTATYCRVVWE